MTIPSSGPLPITGVIFDFHATLVDTHDPGLWIEAAREHLGRPAEGPTVPGSPEFLGLSDHLHRIWEFAFTFDPKSERDLSPARHHEVFRRAAGLRPGLDPDLIEALYAVMPDQWVAFDDSLPVLRELNTRGIRVAVLSNAGIDIRPCLERSGLTEFVDGIVLSYEIGAVKPDPAIFRAALERLDRPAGEALMVGDSGRDDVGGTALGIRTLILPRTIGPIHGLAGVLKLVG